MTGTCCKLRVGAGFQVVTDMVAVSRKVQLKHRYLLMKAWYQAQDESVATQFDRYPSCWQMFEEWRHAEAVQTLYAATTTETPGEVEEEEEGDGADKRHSKVQQTVLQHYFSVVTQRHDHPLRLS